MTLSFWKVMFSAQEILDLVNDFEEGHSLGDFEIRFTELAEKRSRQAAVSAAQAAIAARRDGDWETVTPDFASSFHDDAAEARAQVAELRTLIDEMLGTFKHTAAGNWSALVVGALVTVWRERAGLEG